MTRKQLQELKKSGTFKGVRDMVRRIKELKEKEVQN